MTNQCHNLPQGWTSRHLCTYRRGIPFAQKSYQSASTPQTWPARSSRFGRVFGWVPPEWGRSFCRSWGRWGWRRHLVTYHTRSEDDWQILRGRRKLEIQVWWVNNQQSGQLTVLLQTGSEPANRSLIICRPSWMARVSPKTGLTREEGGGVH